MFIQNNPLKIQLLNNNLKLQLKASCEAMLFVFQNEDGFAGARRMIDSWREIMNPFNPCSATAMS